MLAQWNVAEASGATIGHRVYDLVGAGRTESKLAAKLCLVSGIGLIYDGQRELLRKAFIVVRAMFPALEQGEGSVDYWL